MSQWLMASLRPNAVEIEVAFHNMAVHQQSGMKVVVTGAEVKLIAGTEGPNVHPCVTESTPCRKKIIISASRTFLSNSIEIILLWVLSFTTLLSILTAQLI